MLPSIATKSRTPRKDFIRVLNVQQERALKSRQKHYIDLFDLKKTRYQKAEALKTYELYQDICNKEDFEEWQKGIEKRHKRRLRFYDKLENIIGYYRMLNRQENVVLVFGTCTFNNKEMKNKEETRTKKVNKWLNRHFLCAMANIDYGSKNEREHHHFVALTREEVEPINRRGKSGLEEYELKDKDYNLGFEPTLELIRLNENSKALSNYMAKINNHSNKKSTRNRRLRVFGLD